MTNAEGYPGHGFAWAELSTAHCAVHSVQSLVRPLTSARDCTSSFTPAGARVNNEGLNFGPSLHYTLQNHASTRLHFGAYLSEVG